MTTTTTHNPSPMTLEDIAESDARDALTRRRDAELAGTVSAEIESLIPSTPLLAGARKQLAQRRARARALFSGSASGALLATAGVAFFSWLSRADPSLDWAGIAVLICFVFTVGLGLIVQGLVFAESTQPTQAKLDGTTYSKVHGYFRERGIALGTMSATAISANLIGGWHGADERSSRTDRIHTDLPKTQALLDEWSAADNI